ncbi:hypothetical protein GCM10027425_25420 [Alteromonas gracilis]
MSDGEPLAETCYEFAHGGASLICGLIRGLTCGLVRGLACEPWLTNANLSP